jgi:hypothetical protein
MVVGLGLLGPPVQHGIVYRYDLTVHFHCVRQPDRVIIEEAGERLSDDALAGPRRSVQEERAAGQHRRAKLIQGLGIEYQIFEGTVQLPWGDRDAANALRTDAADIVVERHGCNACVLILGQQLQRPRLSRRRGGDAVYALVHGGDLAELVLA